MLIFVSFIDGVVVACPLVPFLLQARLVRRLPNFGQGYGAVESMENAERQRHALHQWPGNEPVKVQLHLEIKR